jgi:hypothetical protein
MLAPGFERFHGRGVTGDVSSGELLSTLPLPIEAPAISRLRVLPSPSGVVHRGKQLRSLIGQAGELRAYRYMRVQKKNYTYKNAGGW